MKTSNIFPIPPGLDPSLYDSVIWIVESNYASIYGLGNGGVKLVAKKIKSLPRLHTSRVGLATINKITLLYINELKKLGVLVPDYYEVLMDQGESWHFSSYVGNDYSDINEGSVRNILKNIINSIAGFLQQSDWNIGLDPRLTNFAGNNQAIYIDFFPPLCIVDNTAYVHYPNPLDETIVKKELQRKFTAEGVIRRLRFDVMSHNPDWDVVLNDVILSELPKSLSSRLLLYIEKLPDNLLKLSKSTADELIEGYCKELMNDELREIALRLIPLGDNRQTLLNDVFHLTSNFHSRPQYPVLYEDRIKLFKKMIKKYL